MCVRFRDVDAGRRPFSPLLHSPEQFDRPDGRPLPDGAVVREGPRPAPDLAAKRRGAHLRVFISVIVFPYERRILFTLRKCLCTMRQGFCIASAKSKVDGPFRKNGDASTRGFDGADPGLLRRIGLEC